MYEGLHKTKGGYCDRVVGYFSTNQESPRSESCVTGRMPSKSAVATTSYKGSRYHWLSLFPYARSNELSRNTPSLIPDTTSNAANGKPKIQFYWEDFFRAHHGLKLMANRSVCRSLWIEEQLTATPENIELVYRLEDVRQTLAKRPEF